MSTQAAIDGGDLSIVIPAFNEEDAISATLAQLKAALPGAEIIVINDCSSDQTGARAREVDGVIVTDHAFNRGYGAALKTGMRLTTRSFIAWFDADGEMRTEDLAQMYTDLKTSRLAAVIGQRPRRATTHTRTIGKMIIRMTAKVLGLHMGHDLNCGLRVFRREAIMPYLMILPDAFSASTTSTMIMAERAYPVTFYPVTMKPRVGESKVKLKHGFASLAIVLRTVMLFAPLRIFLGLCLPLIFTGFAYALVAALFTGRGVPALAVLMILTGMLLFVVGLLADQISQMRLAQLRHLDFENKQSGARNTKDAQ